MKELLAPAGALVVLSAAAWYMGWPQQTVSAVRTLIGLVF